MHAAVEGQQTTDRLRRDDVRATHDVRSRTRVSLGDNKCGSRRRIFRASFTSALAARRAIKAARPKLLSGTVLRLYYHFYFFVVSASDL